MDLIETLSSLVAVVAAIVFIATTALQIYGIVHCFKKAWYIGLAAIVFPGFGCLVGIFKLLEKDLLA